MGTKEPEGQAAEETGKPPLCQACHEAPPVVRVVRLVEGGEVEAWLCAECARTDIV